MLFYWICVFFFSWTGLYKVFQQTFFYKKNKEKIYRNYISATHSVGSIFLCLGIIYINEKSIFLLCYYSTSYFVWDSIYIIFNRKKKEIAYLFHHGVAIYMLQIMYQMMFQTELQSNISNTLVIFFLFGELSNIPLYIVYWKLKTNETHPSKIKHSVYKNIKYWRIIQIVWFVCIRMFLFSYFGFYTFVYLELPLGFVLLAYCIYGLGMYWGFAQMKSIYRDYYLHIGKKFSIINNNNE